MATLVVSAFTSFPTIASAARFGTICNRTIYGLPDYQACYDLLFGNHGIFSIDGKEHGFLLPYFGSRSEFTDWQWRQRIGLPEVWRNRRSAPSFAYH